MSGILCVPRAGGGVLELVQHEDEVAPGLVLTSGVDRDGAPFSSLTHFSTGQALFFFFGDGDRDPLAHARAWLAEHGAALRALDWTLSPLDLWRSKAHADFAGYHREQL